MSRKKKNRPAFGAIVSNDLGQVIYDWRIDRNNCGAQKVRGLGRLARRPGGGYAFGSRTRRTPSLKSVVTPSARTG